MNDPHILNYEEEGKVLDWLRRVGTLHPNQREQWGVYIVEGQLVGFSNGLLYAGKYFYDESLVGDVSYERFIEHSVWMLNNPNYLCTGGTSKGYLTVRDVQNDEQGEVEA